MNWKTIRLELASTPEYPAGSAGRAYLIRLPLDSTGALDEAALNRRPAQATVRRFWPCEPDRCGSVERTKVQMRLHCHGGVHGDMVSLLDQQPLRLGGQVIVTEADGLQLPFRVTSIVPLP